MHPNPCHRRHRPLLCLWGLLLLVAGLAGGCGMADGADPLPPPDRCALPSNGSITSVEIGRGGTGPFVPLQFGDLADITVGGQGFEMMPVRYRIRGSNLPACIRQRTGASGRTAPPDDWSEVPLKTYPQPDGSRVTREFWFILSAPLWFRLTGEVAGQTVAVDLRGNPVVPLPPEGTATYAAVRILSGTPAGTVPVCFSDIDGNQPVYFPGSPLDGATLWRKGQLLGVVRPGSAVRTEAAAVSSCGGIELAPVSAVEGSPDGAFAYLAGGSVQWQFGGCSQASAGPYACDGLGPLVVPQTGDQIDLHTTLAGSHWPGQRLYSAAVQATAGGAWIPLLQPAGSMYYLTVP